MSKKHRTALRIAAKAERAARVISKMTLGDVLTHREKLFSPLKEMRFEAIIQPLYTSDSIRSSWQ